MWGLAWTRFKRNKVALAGLFIVGYIVFMALFAGFIAPYSPTQPNWIGNQLQSGLPPSWAHPFGTDLDGRDVFSRVVYGAQDEMIIGIGCTVLAVGIAIVVGIVAGYYGKWIDEILMRITEVFLVLPFFLILLVLMEILLTKFPGGGFGGLWIIILIIGGLSWPSNARIIRGEVLSLREFDYIQAEKCLGASSNRILFRHILPNVLYLCIVLATLSFAGAILTEAGISFLGFGDPNSITWGQILTNATDTILMGQWWTLLFPGFFITLLVLGFNLLGNGLRDALDPRLRE
jgi:ABC-type dipeptide/oligopeptide/nickel transport system permease subunit